MKCPGCGELMHDAETDYSSDLCDACKESCEHPRTIGWMRRETAPHMRKLGVTHEWCWAFKQPGDPKHHDRIVCEDCGAWLSLGHSDETDERVAIEIRAVEVVDKFVNKRGRLGLTGDSYEIDGWCAHSTDVDDANHEEPGYQSGYLARAIVLHDQEQP